MFWNRSGGGNSSCSSRCFIFGGLFREMEYRRGLDSAIYIGFSLRFIGKNGI